jgi:hypothetical protein
MPVSAVVARRAPIRPSEVAQSISATGTIMFETRAEPLDPAGRPNVAEEVSFAAI